MTGPTSSDASQTQVRIGTAERNEATKALDTQLEAGRLDAEEYGNRVAQVSVARTQADLEPLFRDLPAPAPSRPVTAPAPTRAPQSGTAASQRPAGRGSWWDERPQALGGRAGEAVMAATPAVALIAFFVLMGLGVGPAWLVFLAIPIVSGVIYGDSKGHKCARRARRRGYGHGW